MEFTFWYALKEDENEDLILNNWLNTYETNTKGVDDEGILKFIIKLSSLEELTEIMCDLGDDIMLFGDCVNPKLSTARSMKELGLV